MHKKNIRGLIIGWVIRWSCAYGMCLYVSLCVCVCIQCVGGWWVVRPRPSVQNSWQTHTHPLWTEGSTRVLGLLHSHTHTFIHRYTHTTHVACPTLVFGSCWVSWVCLWRQRETWDIVFVCVCVYTITCTDHICHRRLGPKGLHIVDLATVLHWHVWGSSDMGVVHFNSNMRTCRALLGMLGILHHVPLSFVHAGSRVQFLPHFPCMNMTARLENQQWNCRDSMRAHPTHLMTPLGTRESGDSHSL